MLYTEDFTMCHYVGFSQIGSHMYMCLFVCLCICEFMHMCIKLSTLDMRTTHIHIYAIIIYLDFCMYVLMCTCK